MGRRDRERKQAIIDGKIQSIASMASKDKGLIFKTRNPYQTLKDTLTNSGTPESAKNDFKVRTLNQLKIEANTYLQKYKDKDKAAEELLKTITDDKQYMEILAIVGIDEKFLNNQIKIALDKI